jgi:glutathione S-transferase
MRNPKQVLEKLLGDGREYICGDTFSVADIAIASYLLYMPQV